MVSAGCSAAISHATAACLAGGNPEMHIRLPNLTGFPKDEVIIPTASRNQYDAAVRALGVKIVEVDSPESLQLALGPRTAMIYIMAGPSNETGPMSTEAISAAAKARNVPVLVDAAAEVSDRQPEHSLAAGRDARLLQRRQSDSRARRALGSFLGARISARPRGCTARRITATRAR